MMGWVFTCPGRLCKYGFLIVEYSPIIGTTVCGLFSDDGMFVVMGGFGIVEGGDAFSISA